MLESFEEGKVYEVLLVTRSNATPVGVVRKGKRLFFKLFGGKSSNDIREHPYAAVQITNDVELLVRLALNLSVSIEFEEHGAYRWISGLPGLYGSVEFEEGSIKDELGESYLMRCSLLPEGSIEGKLPLRPLSRADCLLIEMAVDLTRLLVAVERNKSEVVKRLRERIENSYTLYKRLGGNSPTAEEIIKLAGTGG